MTISQLRKKQIVLCNKAVQEQRYCANIQLAVNHVGWSWMSAYNDMKTKQHMLFTMVDSVRVGMFYFLFYSYEVKHSKFAVVKVSEKAKTSSFEEQFSLN